MKKISSAVVLLLLQLPYRMMACDVCQANQPKVLKGITHGTGPQGNSDYIIIWSAVVIVGITLFLSLKFLIRPNEGDANHIKNIVVIK